MSILRIIQSPSENLWAIVVKKTQHGNLEQTYEYGEAIKRAHQGSEIVRLLALEKELPVGLIQGHYEKKLGYGRNLRVGGPYGSAPVSTLKDKKGEVIKSLIEGIENFALKNRIVEGEIHWPQKWGFSSVFEDLKYEMRYTYNVYLVPLPDSVSSLWSRFHPNKRKNIKKAELAGVKVECSQNEKDFRSFLKMLKAAALRANFDPRISEMEELWQEFNLKGSAKVFLAKWKDRDVAATFIITHGRTAYARGAGSIKEAWKVRPNDVLHWKAMEWACRQGYKWYNMGSTPEPAPSEGSPLWGLWRWKREWRGIFEGISVYSKVYLPKLRRFMNATRRARRIFH